MRLRVLGCHGGESTSHRATSFLIDDTLLLDAGSTTRGLTVEEQTKIDHVFISHAHMDHVRDLALLSDNVIGVRQKPLDIYCTAPTADVLEKHLFNNLLWPDFTKIPNPSDPEKRPTLRIKRIESGATIEVGSYAVKTVAVNHTIDTQALFVRGKGGTICYSSDTGPTDALFDELNARDDLRCFIFEVSFPNNMEQLAKVSGHLTPLMMANELKKYKPKTAAPVLIYHLKPGFHDLLKEQIAELKDARVTVLKPMDEFQF